MPFNKLWNSAKHPRGNKYLCLTDLIGFPFLIWPQDWWKDETNIEEGKKTKETKQSLSSNWVTPQKKVTAVNGHPADERERREIQNNKKGRSYRRIIRALRAVLHCSDTHMHENSLLVHTHMHTHTFVHRILCLSARVCRLSRASSQTESKGSVRVRCLWWKFGRQA